MKRIYIASEIEHDFPEIYLVLFQDNTGQSILSKTKRLDIARQRANKFKRDLDKGRLLKADKTIYNV